MELGERIKSLRKQHRLSQAELASRVGINPTHLGRLESGRFTPSVEVLMKLATVFELTTDALLKGTPPPTNQSRLMETPLGERIPLLESLDETDQQVLTHIIDCMLTKQRMRSLLDEPPLRKAG